MEKYIFMLLGLHLYTEFKLFVILCCIGLTELFIQWIIMKKKGFFLEPYDIFIMSFLVITITYILFMHEHITFFGTLFYINVYLIILYILCSLYKD